MAFETASISTPEYGQQIQGRKGANFYCKIAIKELQEN